MKTQFLFNALIAALLVAILTGCASVRDNVPATCISGKIMGQPYNLEFPKDMTADKIEINVTTNGSVSVLIEKISARQNTEAITMTGSAYKQMREADAQLVKTSLESGATAAEGVAGAIIKH